MHFFVSALSGHHIMVCINLVPCFFPVWNWKQKFIVRLSKMAWTRPAPLSTLASTGKRSRPQHASEGERYSSLIICLVFSGEIPNYIIKFICVRLMLRVFFLFLKSAIKYIKLYLLCSDLLLLLLVLFFLLMSLLSAVSSATLRGMIVNLFSLGQFMIFKYFIISLLGSECKNRKRPINLFLVQMISI